MRATARITSGGPRPIMKIRSRYSKRDAGAAWVFMTPALILFALFILIPTVAGIVLSFFDWNFFSEPSFVGLVNYERLFADPEAWQSLGVTLLFVALGVVPTVLLGFMLAVLLNANMPGIGVARLLYFVPVVLSVAVSAVLWVFLYDPRQGPVATALRTIGIDAPNFLQDRATALPSLVVMMIWLALPIVIILYMSALQRVPDDIYAAAALDGAGPWRTLWSMTWPNVLPTTLIVAVLQVINFVSSSLDVALIMTDGGPLDATRSLGLYAYQEAFKHQNVGYASTLSLLQMVVIVAIVVLGRLVTNRSSK
ncbi:ABC-type sugar transport system, permease component [Arthrobacter sp. PAMC 25486]|uniref:carbohydrate ABC transporter permease n=1 Tax=Arthrobacter sp. PAMC 25486 TaxID=1494608 RepID=UPI000535E03F|nr:sugar ABC transporter permease [Arthrobacter sp. PAMC 25486]AIY02687.1 ABC-type sugar transport system, permease component [Arthrobacter sp. PAMC 25486]